MPHRCNTAYSLISFKKKHWNRTRNHLYHEYVCKDKSYHCQQIRNIGKTSQYYLIWSLLPVVTYVPLVSLFVIHWLYLSVFLQCFIYSGIMNKSCSVFIILCLSPYMDAFWFLIINMLTSFICMLCHFPIPAHYILQQTYCQISIYLYLFLGSCSEHQVTFTYSCYCCSRYSSSFLFCIVSVLLFSVVLVLFLHAVWFVWSGGKSGSTYEMARNIGTETVWWVLDVHTWVWCCYVEHSLCTPAILIIRGQKITVACSFYCPKADWSAWIITEISNMREMSYCTRFFLIMSGKPTPEFLQVSLGSKVWSFMLIFAHGVQFYWMCSSLFDQNTH